MLKTTDLHNKNNKNIYKMPVDQANIRQNLNNIDILRNPSIKLSEENNDYLKS
jgi:hypothetical protein